MDRRLHRGARHGASTRRRCDAGARPSLRAAGHAGCAARIGAKQSCREDAADRTAQGRLGAGGGSGVRSADQSLLGASGCGCAPGWLPEHFSGPDMQVLPCPRCKDNAHVTVKNWTARRVVDSYDCYWLFGKAYECATCRDLNRRVGFRSWNADVLKLLHPAMINRLDVLITSKVAPSGNLAKSILALGKMGNSFESLHDWRSTSHHERCTEPPAAGVEPRAVHSSPARARSAPRAPAATRQVATAPRQMLSQPIALLGSDGPFDPTAVATQVWSGRRNGP